MALHNATQRSALLVMRGRSFRFTYRYEGWVQFCSRRVRTRVDLAPLAGMLNDRETGSGEWRSTPPSDLTPELFLRDDAESSLAPDVVVNLVREHLRTGSPAWDPSSVTPGAWSVSPGASSVNPG